MKTKTSVIRTRNFATVIYLDSAPSNWLDILYQLKIPMFISPYHDRDLNPDGTRKKPHYHIQFIFDSVKSLDQVKSIISTFNGVGCEILQSLRGYARYLCHLDNPEKVQYDISQVKSLCGADYLSTINLAIDKYKAIREMMAFCKENEIYSFAKLSHYASEYQFDWFRVLCDNGSIFMREYLKSAFNDYYIK